MAFLTFLMHPGMSSPGDKDEPCGLTNDSVTLQLQLSSAKAESLADLFYRSKAYFFKVVFNSFFTVLVSYRRRDTDFKIYLHVVSYPGGFFFRWESTWEG